MFFDLFLDSVNGSALSLISSRAPKEEIDLDVFANVAKPIHLAAIDTLLDEWGASLEAIIPDQAIKSLVNAQAVNLGIEIADAYASEMFWH